MSITWLPLSHRKNINTPKIIFEDPVGQYYGGYFNPNNMSMVILYNVDIKHEASTIAHEFRHLTQFVLNTHKFSGIKPNNKIPYEKMIKWYFRSCPEEMDALIYQNKYAKSDISDWWLNKLVRNANPIGDGTGLENRRAHDDGL